MAAALAQVKRKGLGVVALADIPASTRVATYPGPLWSVEAYESRHARGLTDGTYAVDFYKPGPEGDAMSGWVLDPGEGSGICARHAHALAPRINEPSRGQRPNLMWVWNLPRHAMEFWTTRGVRAGEELLACYGVGGGYRRSYCTSCVGSQTVEPELHVVTARGRQPVPYSSLGDRGVRRAIRTLKA